MNLQRYENQDAALFEKVMLKSDLAGLSPLETVTHIKNICDSLGLNAITNPIEVFEFQGKKKLYFKKEATEQLRSLKKISISIKETKMVDDLYVVIAEAHTRDGRIDSSTGVVIMGQLKGEAKANAMMKAETKAKRRVTLSICGLGFLDESEVDSIPNAKKISPVNEKITSVKVIEVDQDNDQILMDASSWQFRIEAMQTLDDLKEVYEELKLSDMKKNPKIYKDLIKFVEDCRFKIIKNTGEVQNV